MNLIILSSLLLCFVAIQPFNVQSVPCAGLVNPYHCISLGGLSPEQQDECVEREWVCDNTRDCPFGDDEWNCNDDSGEECTDANGYFECFNSIRSDFLTTNNSDNICLRREYSCLEDDDAWDCPNQEDLLPSVCQDFIDFPCQNDSLDPFDVYFECSINGVCIFEFQVCDSEGFEHCLDGEDESEALCATNPPTNIPTDVPSDNPSDSPTERPSISPSNNPSINPSRSPSNNPTRSPTDRPSDSPTNDPSRYPTRTPSNRPTNDPTDDGGVDEPTNYPTWFEPTDYPTNYPTEKPTRVSGTWWRHRLPTPQPTARTTWWSNYRGSVSGRN